MSTFYSLKCIDFPIIPTSLILLKAWIHPLGIFGKPTKNEGWSQKRERDRQRKIKNIPAFRVTGDMSRNPPSDVIFRRLVLMLETSRSPFGGLGIA